MWTRREKILVALNVLLLGFVFLGGRSLSLVDASEENRERALFDELKIFTDVLSLVERDYVSEVEGTTLVTGAIQGLLSKLDPHSGYLEPDFYQDLQVQTKGEFGGLGIEITIRDGLLVVVAPMEGSPAEQAGIQAGDRIVKIEGDFTKNFTLVDAVKRLRGPKGSPIEISIQRDGVQGLIDVTVVRDKITVKSIRHRTLGEGFGYIRINQFVDSTSDDLKRALQKLREESPTGGIRGLVLDMRNNPGGLLIQAIRVSDLFLKEGVIVYTDGRVESQKQKFFAHQKGTQSEYPIVAIVNGGSASAAEIVAGALKDHGRALILGTQTFGKGSVQTITPLSNGGALTLTTALYYTKSGRSIQALGIEPDIVMEVNQPEPKPEKRTPLERIREGDLPGAIKNPDADDRKKNRRRSPRRDGSPDQRELSDDDRVDLMRSESIPLERLLEIDPQLRRALDLLKTFNVFGAAKESTTLEAVSSADAEGS